MSAGEGDGGRDVPRRQLRIPPPEMEGDRQLRQVGAFRPRPLSPPVVEEVPFRTAKGFGNWLFHHFEEAGAPDRFSAVYIRFLRYTRNFKMRALARCVTWFRGRERLYFLNGLHIIATSVKQKENIRRLFIREREKLLRNAIAPGADIPLPS